MSVFPRESPSREPAPAPAPAPEPEPEPHEAVVPAPTELADDDPGAFNTILR